MASRTSRTAIAIAALSLALGGALCACGGKRSTSVDLPRERPLGSVEIVSNPPGATVILEEGERRLGAAPIVIERPGGTGLKLMLVKEGYRPRRSFVLVEEKNRLRHHVRLERERATLVVRAGALHAAEVSVDGRHVGRTPTRVEVPAGVAVVLDVSKNRFQPYRATLTLQAGETRDVNADLIPEGFKGPRPGQLSIRGPLGAVITLKGRMLGMVPLEQISLPPGRHELEIRASGGKRWKKTAVIKSGEHTTITLD